MWTLLQCIDLTAQLGHVVTTVTRRVIEWRLWIFFSVSKIILSRMTQPPLKIPGYESRVMCFLHRAVKSCYVFVASHPVTAH